MSVNATVRDKLAQRATNVTAAGKPERPEETIRKLLETMKPQIQKALPKHLDPDRLARVALTTIRINPKLLECNATSLMAAVMQSAQLGLEPGILGHCYIIPYGKEAQFQVGYRGMIDLARRSGNIQSIAAHEVYDNDYFRLKYGLEDILEHIPYHLREDKRYDQSGQLRGFYMVAKFKDGGHQIHYMSVQEIDEHRARSKAANSGPWVTDYVEMGKKTVIRSAWKWLPISIEVMRQVEANDETVKRELAEDMSEVPDIIDITPIEQPADEVQAPESEPVSAGLK